MVAGTGRGGGGGVSRVFSVRCGGGRAAGARAQPVALAGPTLDKAARGLLGAYSWGILSYCSGRSLEVDRGDKNEYHHNTVRS